MLSAGTLIWISCRPLLRLVICAGCGFAITKADIFPPVAARGAGQIMLNITLPALLFSKIVPAFDSDNISALGPLVLVAVMYEVIGVLIAWIIKQFFWVPHRFRYGILVAGGWGNYGDIPTSVVMSITGAAPFNGTDDQTLSVAYVAAFILVFMMTLFPFGGHRWIAMDYGGPEVEDEEIRQAIRLKRRRILTVWMRPMKSITRGLRSRRSTTRDSDDSEQNEVEKVIEEKDDLEKETAVQPISPGEKHVSFYPDGLPEMPTEGISSTPLYSRVTTPAPTVTAVEQDLPLHRHPQAGTGEGLEPSIIRHRRWRIFYPQFRTFLQSLFSPASIAIVVAFPIALIPTLKALFVTVSGTHIHPAPDGLPPLNFLMDTATFIGAASVPLGLVCLGSALARLKVPNEWKSLPLGSIISLAVGKMLVMPVLGVLICQGLVRVNVIAKDDKVLQFVCIFFSCLPTATTQVFLTQVYSGTGTAEHLSAFLIPQYFLMFISMTALTAYTLQSLF